MEGPLPNCELPFRLCALPRERGTSSITVVASSGKARTSRMDAEETRPDCRAGPVGLEVRVACLARGDTSEGFLDSPPLPSRTDNGAE